MTNQEQVIQELLDTVGVDLMADIARILDAHWKYVEDDIKVAVACTEETLIMHYEDKIDKLKKDLKEMDEMSADLAAIIVKRDKQIEAMQNYVDYSQRELL
jgi:hypothetical protein